MNIQRVNVDLNARFVIKYSRETSTKRFELDSSRRLRIGHRRPNERNVYSEGTNPVGCVYSEARESWTGIVDENLNRRPKITRHNEPGIPAAACLTFKSAVKIPGSIPTTGRTSTSACVTKKERAKPWNLITCSMDHVTYDVCVNDRTKGLSGRNWDRLLTPRHPLFVSILTRRTFRNRIIRSTFNTDCSLYLFYLDFSQRIHSVLISLQLSVAYSLCLFYFDSLERIHCVFVLFRLSGARLYRGAFYSFFFSFFIRVLFTKLNNRYRLRGKHVRVPRTRSVHFDTDCYALRLVLLGLSRTRLP